MTKVHHKMLCLVLPAGEYQALRNQVLERDGWRCQLCGKPNNLHVHRINSRGKLGDDAMDNLITLCANCHNIYIAAQSANAREACSSIFLYPQS